VRIAADFNRWNPEADTLTPVAGAEMFFRTIRLPRDSRIEYKLVVDSLWMTDPLNPHIVRGGFGENSELRMPAFVPDSLAAPKAGVAPGTIDTLAFTSRLLGRTHPVFVYSPFDAGPDPLPVLYVLDGGEYLSIARMNLTLDNLIAGRRIRPLLAVFFDPRTNTNDPASNRRMSDYTLNETFVQSMMEELVPFVSSRYRIADQPGETGLLGASLGGLASTYAVWRNPEVFGVALVQSPAYRWNDERIFDLVTKTPARGGRFWIETGTIHDAGEYAFRMRDLLRSQGREVAYAEVPQGHNWVHWQWTIPAALEFFVGPPK
jgi:enterochelin esterase family protein